MSDFSTPHPDCTARHTKYQPTEAEWRCPKCLTSDSGTFYIESPDEAAHPDCIALHDADELYCYSSEHDSPPGWTGKRFAGLLMRKNNLIPCRHCHGKGYISAEKSGGDK